MTWLRNNWGKVGAVLLTALVAANTVWGFLPADILTLIVTVAGSLGIGVVSATAKGAAKQSTSLRAMLDELVGDDDEPPPPTLKMPGA